MTKIKFNNGTTEKSLEVESIFAYTYNAMKTVLKIQILESKHSFEEVAELRKCVGKIKVYEVTDTEKLVGEYSGFTLGDKGFVSNYKANGNDMMFDIEITQESSYEVRLESIESTIEEILMMLMGE